ncbi:DUF4118 domain-containing protein [Bradyrhizobium sp. SZCCHNS2096]|uniref:DUF4118 domain-containing protein n=1 Tax=Bradyrhizobium sp. SZCCHNS2096 TaxID=3057309 RepID=UPI00291616DA|nr:DUF4118 domain-containing protein [Bradyrhizobium sp. SZCCHNS2096]
MLVPQSSIAPVGLCVVGLAASLSRQSTPGGPRRDQQAVLDKIIRFADETRPLSWRAATVAAACVLSATVLRLLVPRLGTEVPFATYFPAILLTGLLAGTPAAFGAAIASTLIACWAFMTPRFAFTADKLSWPLLAWAFSVSLLLVFTHYGRLIMLRMRASQQEHELVAHELEHRGRNTFAVIQTVVQQALIDSLTPASGCQDHTAWPSATSCARLSQLTTATASRLHVRDDAYAPSMRRDGQEIA